MSRLERYYLDDFSANEHAELADPHSEPVFMVTPSGQHAFEFLDITRYEDSAVKAARIGGVALLANAKFDGHMSLIDQHGEITIRHRRS